MKLEGYIACICEGGAERAIMNLLLENNRLIFNEDDLLEGEIIKERSAKKFENRYLKKGFNQKITIVRILDSRSEKFILSKAYRNKIEVINVITAPEIEMLIIINENKYVEYKKKHSCKPSEFCKDVLKYDDVKSYDFVHNYFSNIGKLIQCINEYKKISKIRKGEKTLADLIEY